MLACKDARHLSGSWAELAELFTMQNPAEPSQNPSGILQDDFAEPAGGRHDPAAQVDPAKILSSDCTGLHTCSSNTTCTLHVLYKCCEWFSL